MQRYNSLCYMKALVQIAVTMYPNFNLLGFVIPTLMINSRFKSQKTQT